MVAGGPGCGSGEEIVRTLREARGGRLIGGVRPALLHAWEQGRVEPSMNDVAVWAWALRHDIELTGPDGDVTARGELYGLMSSASAQRAATNIVRSCRGERRRKRLSKNAAAMLLGISVVDLERWERGQRSPQIGAFVDLVTLYDLRVCVVPYRPSVGFGELGWRRQAPVTPWSRGFPGLVEQIRAAQAFVWSFTEEHPRAEQIATVVDELTRYAVTCTASGEPDGFFVVRVLAETLSAAPSDAVTVEVVDLGQRRQPADFAVTAELADKWGANHRATWARFEPTVPT